MLMPHDSEPDVRKANEACARKVKLDDTNQQTDTSGHSAKPGMNPGNSKSSTSPTAGKTYSASKEGYGY